MTESRKFVALVDKATKRTVHLLLTAKEEAALTIATPPAATPAPAGTPALPAPYAPPPAGDLPQTC